MRKTQPQGSHPNHDDTATLQRLDPLDAEFYAALSETLAEWSSHDDDEAFGHL